MTLFFPAEPARTAAATFVERYDIIPPVPIEELLVREADVQEGDWPHSTVDAVMYRELYQKPVVFYRPLEHRQRWRFTLAHELGHLRLAWHLGIMMCEMPTPSSDGTGWPGRSTEEQEADIFASCLLVPDRWLTDLSNKHADDMDALLSQVAEADVSATASLLALRRVLSAGWVFQINNRYTKFSSRGTVVPPSLTSAAQDYGTKQLAGQTIHWWRLTPPYSIPNQDNDRRRTIDLLRSAIASFEPDPAKGIFIERSANGRIGGVGKDDAGKPPGEVFASLMYRFRDCDYAAIADHPDFKCWLARKARKISGK